MPPTPKKKGGAKDVAVMEQRLALLKQQMEEEKLRREEILASSGGESVWQSGRRGIIRGRGGAGVGELVRARARPAARAAAPPARTSPDNEPLDRESPALSTASTEQSVLDAGEGTSPLPLSRPVSRDAPPAPFQRPPSPKEVAAMECQTDLPRRQWAPQAMTPRSRPESARGGGSSYFEKIMKARQMA